MPAPAFTPKKLTSHQVAAIRNALSPARRNEWADRISTFGSRPSFAAAIVAAGAGEYRLLRPPHEQATLQARLEACVARARAALGEDGSGWHDAALALNEALQINRLMRETALFVTAAARAHYAPPVPGPDPGLDSAGAAR